MMSAVCCWLPPPATPTYAANGQRQAHRVQHGGGDRAVVEGVPDAVVATEKAPLIGAHFAQVKGRQGQATCGRRDGREEAVSQSVKLRCERTFAVCCL